MNKKGYTLIEIIITIGIVLIVGTISIVSFNVNNKINRELESITNSILTAANLYIKTELDENGSNYLTKIQNGNKGVKIPLTNLVNNGYIKEETINKLYDLKNDTKQDGKSYYVMFVENTNNYCDDGSFVTISSWMDEGNNVYLCDYNGAKNNNSLYETIINMPFNTDCNKSSCGGALCYLHSEIDDVADKNNDGTVSDIWYFRGNVDNNYLKIDGLSNIYRIVRTTENNGVKIIDDFPISNNVFSDSCYHLKWHKAFAPGDYFWTIDGDKISYYARGSGYKYECVSDMLKASLWEYSDTVCGGSPSPIYNQLYLPLLNRYNEQKVILEDYIDRDYKWCTSSNAGSSISSMSFKCNSEKLLESDFGILNWFEYEYIQCSKMQGNLSSSPYYSYYYNYNLSSSSCDTTSEIAFGRNDREFLNTRYLLPNFSCSSSCSSPKSINIRPAYVIKGNSKVISGDGTKGNPYIINEE